MNTATKLSHLRMGVRIRSSVLSATSISGLKSRNLFSNRGSSSNRSSRAELIGKVGLGLATAGCAFWWWKEKQRLKLEQRLDPAELISNPDEFFLSSSPPDFDPARSVRISGSAANSAAGIKKLTLFQYQTCPFCCKTRSFLDYYGFEYDVIEVNSVTRKQLKWSPDYKKVPMLVAETEDGKIVRLVDSSLIVSTLTSLMINAEKNLREILAAYPKFKYFDLKTDREKTDFRNKYFLMLNGDVSPQVKAELGYERKWREFADEQLVHSLSPNVYRSPAEALQAFNWFSEVGDWETHFSAWERYLVIYVGALAMWIIGKRLKKRHHLKKDVRESLYEDCISLTRELKKNEARFLGGSRPNLADLAVYGCLSAIEGCQPTFNDLLENTDVGKWFHAVKGSVNSHDGMQAMPTFNMK